MKLRDCLLCLVSIALCALSSTAQADSYYVVEVRNLELVVEDSKIPDQLYTQTVQRQIWRGQNIVSFPYLQLEQANAEAYIGFPPLDEDESNNRWWMRQGSLLVGIRLKNTAAITGSAILQSPGTSRMRSIPFKFDPATAKPTTREAFEAVRKSNYTRLSKAPIPGAAWFRHLSGETPDPAITENPMDPFASRQDGHLNETFNLFSGHRAIAENLALDRAIILAESEDDEDNEPIPLKSIQGVTVRAIDWSERLQSKEVPLDPLAAHLPEDQHAAFFPSIKALNLVMDALDSESAPALEARNTTNPYRKLINRYEGQMGLRIPNIISEKMPIQSVAITGGDPFFPSGTDIAVVFQTAQPDALFAAISSFIGLQANAVGATTEKLDGGAVAYTTADRSFSAYILQSEHYVAVANSPAQLKHLSAVAVGDSPSLASTDEFKYFRQRYPLENDASAFLFLSDATIRRWASPVVRIGASRRTRAAAVLAESTARLIDNQPLGDDYQALVGTVEGIGETAQSEHYNTLAFLTPISELDIETVTKAEQDGYLRWRRGYENGWRQVFDPIALSLKITDTSYAIDLSVIPLTLGSEYDDWIELAGQSTLDAPARKAHPEALIFTSFAVDPESAPFMQANSFSQSMVPGFQANPLAWIGQSISIFIDGTPFWQDVQAAEDPENYIERNLGKFPIGIRIASRSTARLAIFLTGLRSFSEQAAPGLLRWETREHNEKPYVVISDDDSLTGELEIALYYAAQKDALLLSLDETVLHRAMDRAAATKEAPEEPAEELEPQHIFGFAQLDFLKDLPQWSGESSLQKQQIVSWSALPILNEWHKRFPDQNPVEVHEKYFRQQIVCPRGQGYQWNETLKTMESVAFGSPLEPKGDTPMPIMNPIWKRAKANLHFEDDGLRLQATIEQ